MRRIAQDTPPRETRAGDALVSRRRFLELGAAWAMGMALFVAAGCGGEEGEDEGGEEEED